MPEVRVCGSDCEAAVREPHLRRPAWADLCGWLPPRIASDSHVPVAWPTGMRNHMATPFRPAPSGGSAARTLTPAELAGWNDTTCQLPEATLPELFQAQAARTPHAAAVTCGDITLSYAELDERANRLAGFLASLGAGPERLVAVVMGKSAEVFVAWLGVAKSGAAAAAGGAGGCGGGGGAGAGGAWWCGCAAPAGAGGSGVCHLHVGVDGQAEGDGGDAPGAGEPGRVDGQRVRDRPWVAGAAAGVAGL